MQIKPQTVLPVCCPVLYLAELWLDVLLLELLEYWAFCWLLLTAYYALFQHMLLVPFVCFQHGLEGDHW